MDKKYQKEIVYFTDRDRDILRRLFTYLKPYRYWLLVAIIFLLISKIIEAAVPIFIGKITQKVLDGASLGATEKHQLLEQVTLGCFVILGFLVLAYLLDSLNVILKSWIGQKAVFSLRQDVYEHLLRMPVAYYDHHTVGRMMTRTVHDVDQLNQMFSESLVPILGNIFLFISIFISLAVIDWRIVLLFLALMPIIFILTNRFRYYQRICYDRVRTIISAMNTFFQEHLMGASTIRNFGLQKKSQHQFEAINQDYCDAHLDTIHNFSFFVAAIDLLQNISLISVFVLLALLHPFGEFQAGMFFAFSLYALMIFRPLADLAERYNALQAAIAAAGRIFDVMNKKTENFAKSVDHTLKTIHTITFEDVWFAYEKDNWILKGVSFEVKQGESLAIVGVTGEGKTTLISLLLRFYDYQKGSIKINGKEIREYSLASLRQQFSVVLQDPVIFSGSLIDNIGLYDSSISREKIEGVVDYLNLNSLINRFPDGWEHHLSERGKSLSTGELQLISIARALAHYRGVLILDEATANIDSLTEKIIQQALAKILKEKTALVIAHRLSTIKDVSRILVLHHGRVAETGTHQQLLAAQGIYEKLYRLQFT